MFIDLPFKSLIVTSVILGVPTVSAPSGVISEMVTKNEWGPSSTSSTVVGIKVHLERGGTNDSPSVNIIMYVPDVKSSPSVEQNHIQLT